MDAHGLKDRIYRELLSIPVIDTHEHLWHDESSIYKEDDDVLREYLIHYMKSDVISAGLKPALFQQVIDHDLRISERWKIVEPFWESARYTGYGRALDLSVKTIYGIDGVHANTIEDLNTAFLSRRKPGHYAYVLRDLCNIEISLLDVWTFHFDHGNDLFKRVWQAQNFLEPSDPEGYDFIPEMEHKHKIKIASLDDWLAICEKELDHTLAQNGARVIKSSCAYWRPLRFEKVEYAEVKSLFADAFKSWHARGEERMLPRFPIALQDYMMHYQLKLANERNLTFQFHTGLFEGNGNTLSNGNPSLLNNLFAEYPNVDFDLFHISYPYQGVACALCKMFPNVFIDMCWAHIISPTASVSALDDFLDAIPYNKISAFGGDYLFVDGIYGHLELSRQNISEVLAKKVEHGVFSEEKALTIAKALYYDNPKRIFKL